MPVGGPIFQAFAKAASFTARGAAVTFGSTMLSCMAACKIEEGANRLIYRYAPHKFADVEWANGLTEEQLLAVRVYRTSEATTTAESDHANEHDVTKTTRPIPLLVSAEQALHEAAVQPQHMSVERQDAPEESPVHQHIPRNNNKSTREADHLTRFWKEGEETLTALIPVGLPRQEILACAMTG